VKIEEQYGAMKPDPSKKTKKATKGGAKAPEASTSMVKCQASSGENPVDSA
jgi:hypothetical protein